MVKVLENKLIDLDLLPGQAQIDLQRQFKEQLNSAKKGGPGNGSGEIELPEGARVVEGPEGAKIASQQGFQIPKEMLPDNLSEEQKKQAKGFGGVIVDGSGRVISGLSGTVGGVLKGVGDTAGNLVYGLGSTGAGLVTGLADTAKAPFAAAQSPGEAPAQPQGSAPSVQAPSTEEPAAEAAAEADVPPEKRKPRKIEMRSGGGQPAAEPSAAGQTVEH